MQVKINTQSIYAPIRYEASRPYATNLGKQFITHDSQGEQQRLQFIRGDLFDMLRNQVSKLGYVDGPGPVQNELINIQVFGHFQAHGKVIFDVAKPLTASLLATDADDVPISALTFPTTSSYFHYGVGTNLYSDGLEIQGAFVTLIKDRLLIDLVPAAFGQRAFIHLPMGDPLIGISMDITDTEKPIKLALSDTIKDIVNANDKYFAEIANQEALLTKQYGEVVRIPLSIERLTEKEPLLQKALALVVNTLFYLAAVPEDIYEEWGRDTPHDAISTLERAQKLGTKKTIENTLTKAGYVKVKFVGNTFAASKVANEFMQSAATGRVVGIHIRRGHFRRQAYGEQRTLRKTIFIAPVVVNGQLGDEMPGRIYDVSSSKI